MSHLNVENVLEDQIILIFFVC